MAYRVEIVPRAQRDLLHLFETINARTAHAALIWYPPVAVRPEDRLTYIRALQQSQAGQGTEAFDTLLYERLDAALGEYLSAFEEQRLPGTRQG